MIGLDLVRQSNTIEPKKLCESLIALDFRTQSKLIELCKPSVEIDKNSVKSFLACKNNEELGETNDRLM